MFGPLFCFFRRFVNTNLKGHKWTPSLTVSEQGVALRHTPRTVTRLRIVMKHSFRHTSLLAIAMIASFSFMLAACGSTEGMSGDQSTSANAEDLAGDWAYEVVGIDYLDVRTGTIRFILDQGQLSGLFDAIHLDLAPLRNIRYRAGEATFTAQAVPGLQGGLAFSMMVDEGKMTGYAYLTSNSEAVATRGRPSTGRNTVEIVARKLN